jgi:hypothetical protein
MIEARKHLLDQVARNALLLSAPWEQQAQRAKTETKVRVMRGLDN